MPWSNWECNRCRECGKPSDTVYCQPCADKKRGDRTHHPDCPKYIDRDAGCRCREILMHPYA